MTYMQKMFGIGSLSVVAGVACAFFLFKDTTPLLAETNITPTQLPWFSVQSIDTMKVSRDIARDKLKDESFDPIIQKEVVNIKNTGANYVAVGTPYDTEFVPYLERWVKAARSAGLHVWFRGNFAGWEGWFGYPKIGRQEHLTKLSEFIVNNPTLFEQGDIFTPCHECENGGPGDPRMTGDIDGFRSFMIAERNTAQHAFEEIHKDVYSGYFGTNGDVANLIMDPDTTRALGGVMTIDHYVKTDQDMARDLGEYEDHSQGNIMIGEFGSPIPDINGNQSPQEQAVWLDKMLRVLSQDTHVVGVNYWTSTDSSTALWNPNGSERPAVSVLRKYFMPHIAIISLVDEFEEPVTNVTVKTLNHTEVSNSNGMVAIPVLDDETIATISSSRVHHQMFTIEKRESEQQVKVKIEESSLSASFRRFLMRITPAFLRHVFWHEA